MEALFERAKQNGIAAERIDHVGLMQLEPNVTGVAALLIPSTGIVDYKMISAAFAKIVSAEGTEIELGTEVAIHEDPHAIEISTAQRSWRTVLIVCTDAFSPTASPNWPASRSIIGSCRFRGEFYTYQNLGGIDQSPDLSHSGPKNFPLSEFISPGQSTEKSSSVPTRCWICPRRLRNFPSGPQDVLRTSRSGFWRVIGTHFAAGVEECETPFGNKAIFADPDLPDLSLADLEPGVTAGIRRPLSRQAPLCMIFSSRKPPGCCMCAMHPRPPRHRQSRSHT